MSVIREFPPATEPRDWEPGDVVRDRLFPLAIERIAGIDITHSAYRVVFESGDFVPVRSLHVAYEHADGAPIIGSQS